MFHQFKDSFEPETLKSLGQAFDLAWDYIEKSGLCVFVSKDEGQYKLASALVALARAGETNKIALANNAITQFRKDERVRRPNDRLQSDVVKAVWPNTRQDHFA